MSVAPAETGTRHSGSPAEELTRVPPPVLRLCGEMPGGGCATSIGMRIERVAPVLSTYLGIVYGTPSRERDVNLEQSTILVLTRVADQRRELVSRPSTLAKRAC